jgi:hypothetical protein
LPLIGYFSGLLLAIKITNQWQEINLKNNKSMAGNKPET